ncbi:MAG TPA: MFS transporter [Solirubrobacteraceae bacterium]|jgi:EmrB/QacA subfamily drug resistance transporter
MTRMPSAPGAVLAVLCLCAFAVNVDTTLVNVALPTLVRELDASTRELQWIVDAYTLAFAALVLAAGSLGDRVGRREMLVAGLVVYGAGNAAAGFMDSPAQLVIARTIMGVGAAMIFPTTLSIITNVFRERGPRAKAIGLWGATVGLAVALGPIAGGALLEGLSWEWTFFAKVPVALAAIGLALAIVPTSRDPRTPPLDVPGLLLSTAAIGIVVLAIIEAPEAGWDSAQTVGLLALGLALLAAFVGVERRSAAPMLDVGLFRNLRFSGASAAVTVSFFSLFGFIFLITQYFQFIRGYGPLETGVRMLPVATSVALASIVGTRLTMRVGNKAVVATGLTLLSGGFLWVSTASADTPYLEIAAQMVCLGLGMGFTSAPATESIMGAVSRHRAGIGSAVNDATRELGGTLGVAVIGSVYASLYTGAFSGATPAPAPAVDAARESIGAALIAADRLPPDAGAALHGLATSGFFDGLQVGCLVAAGVCAAGALFAAVVLPSQPEDAPAVDESELALAEAGA